MPNECRWEPVTASKDRVGKMPLFGAVKVQIQRGDTPVPINAPVTDVASDVALVPSGKDGLVLSLWNDGPSAVSVAFDVTATPTNGVILNPGEGYAEGDIKINTKVSAISMITGQTATLRGTLWCG